MLNVRANKQTLKGDKLTTVTASLRKASRHD